MLSNYSSPFRATLLLVLVPVYAHGGVIFSDNFDNSSGSSGGYGVHHFERYKTSDPLKNISVPGWSVVGSETDILVVSSDSSPSDKAIWLNETGTPSISRTINGLATGQEYSIFFDHWGDNVAGTYALEITIDGSTQTVTRTSSGHLTGAFATTELSFIANTSSVFLKFADLGTPSTPASGIIDNLRIWTDDVVSTPDGGSTATTLAIPSLSLLLLAQLRKKVRG